uniref:BTB domain-containing protein n=1 Tax=Ditylenchus dipsaci TaxID=166011 RepID=A0A915DKI4_9BILA
MEAMICEKFEDIDGSIQKVQASLVEIHENIGMLVAEEKKHLKYQIEHQTGRELVARHRKEDRHLGAFLFCKIDSVDISRDINFTIRLLGSSENKEMPLPDLFAEEFLHLLKVIYPPFDDADVTPNNVGSLLRLSDCYLVKAVKDRCARYLKECAISEVSMGQKLVYAQNYHLLELLEHCINECKTVDDMNKLRATSHYSELKDSIKLRIHEKIKYP